MELEMRITGNIGADAVVKEFNGKKVINFNVAHSEKYKDSQGVQHEKTTWVSCSYWSESSVAAYLKKGTLITCTGTPDPTTYTAKDGTAKVDFRLNVQRLKLLGAAPATPGSTPANAGASATQAAPASFAASSATDNNGDDLPF